MSVRVWYDEFSLQLGDSLTASIDRGLQESRYGLVVLSKTFYIRYRAQGSIVKNEEKTHGLTIIMGRKRYLCNLKELEDYADRN